MIKDILCQPVLRDIARWRFQLRLIGCGNILISVSAFTRSIELSAFRSPSITLTPRSISEAAEFGRLETHDSRHCRFITLHRYAGGPSLPISAAFWRYFDELRIPKPVNWGPRRR